jgi:ribosomal protein S18 acetylase RimI-like enzyme
VTLFAEHSPDAHGTPAVGVWLRRARPDDVPEIARIVRTRGPQTPGLEDRLRAWTLDDGRHVVVTDDPTGGPTRRPAERPTAPPAQALTAQRTGQPSDASRAAPPLTGWAMLARWTTHDDAPVGWYVSALTVDPRWRRQGLGDRLLADLVDRAAVLSAGDACGESAALRSVVNVRNGPSLALHARHGFVEVARAASFAGITFDGGTGLLLERVLARDGGSAYSRA